jgi:hypothetical protein
MSYFNTLSAAGRNELEDLARKLGERCLEVAFSVSDLADTVPNQAMNAVETRDAFLALVEAQVDRFYSKADPELHAFIEKAAKSVLPKRPAPAVKIPIQSPSFFEPACEIVNPFPIRVTETRGDGVVVPFERKGA